MVDVSVDSYNKPLYTFLQLRFYLSFCDALSQFPTRINLRKTDLVMKLNTVSPKYQLLIISRYICPVGIGIEIERSKIRAVCLQ
jgi:hypothetical protein